MVMKRTGIITITGRDSGTDLCYYYYITLFCRIKLRHVNEMDFWYLNVIQNFCVTL